MKITRREMATLLVSPAAAPSQTPAANPQEELRAAREQVQRNVEALNQFNLPMATEPAVVFRA